MFFLSFLLLFNTIYFSNPSQHTHIYNFDKEGKVKIQTSVGRPDFISDDFVNKRMSDAEGWVQSPTMESRYESAAEDTVPGNSDNIEWNEIN